MGRAAGGVVKAAGGNYMNKHPQEGTLLAALEDQRLKDCDSSVDGDFG